MSFSDVFLGIQHQYWLVRSFIYGRTIKLSVQSKTFAHVLAMGCHWQCTHNIPSQMFSKQYITKSSTTESGFTIVHLMLLFIAYHDWLRVYHWITNALFSLRNELKWLHSHKQYRWTAPLISRIWHLGI